MKVDNAIILAAGIGDRFSPLTYTKHKGLIDVLGETMVERQIKQLIKAGINDITIITGYLSKDYDFLIDKYKGIVKILFNENYLTKNNIYSMYIARKLLRNTYILSCDNYYVNNIFSDIEYNAWYCAVSSQADKNEWGLTLDHNDKIISISKTAKSNQYYMYGAVFFDEKLSEKFRNILEEMSCELEKEHSAISNCLWEQILLDNINEFEIYAKKEKENNVYEFESLEQLRNFDIRYKNNCEDAIIKKISEVFDVKQEKITNIVSQKLGMTNDSFRFDIDNVSYIYRVSGEMSHKIIDRYTEALVYKKIRNLHISDEVIYIDPKTGHKISKFFYNARVINPASKEEVFRAIQMIKKLHNQNIKIDKYFDIKENLLYYERLAKEKGVQFFEDYEQVKEKIFKILGFIKKLPMNVCLCHIDAIRDNILITEDNSLKLIDFEYAAMQDPMIDIAMYAIYSDYNFEQIRELVNIYFAEEEIPKYSYEKAILFAVCGGLLWYTWGEYMQNNNELKDYLKSMYDYAKLDVDLTI